MSDNKPKAFSGIKSTWANPRARQAIMLSAGVVGVVLVVTGMSMRNSGNKGGSGISSSATLAAPPRVAPDVTAAVTPEYRDKILQRDGERAAQASKSNTDMALPAVAGLTQTTPAPTNFGNGAGMVEQQPAPMPTQMAPAPNPQSMAMMQQADMQARAQMEAQIRGTPGYTVAGAFMTSAAQSINSGRSSQFGIILAPGANKAPVAGGPSGQVAPSAGAPSGGDAGAQPQPVIPARVLIPAGTALYATMDTAINSDYGGPVVATVRQGPFRGAKLLGTKTTEYDAVVLRFNAISVPNGGPAVPIQAYAINLGDVSKFGTTGLQGNVDYHVLQRYVLPAIMAFGQSYGYAASVTGTSTTTTGTQTTQATQALSDKDRSLVALGGALAPIAADLQRQAQRPITIRMDANTEIGVLFSADVTDKAQEAAMSQAAAGGMTGISGLQNRAVATGPQGPYGVQMQGYPAQQGVMQQPAFAPGAPVFPGAPR